MTKQSNLKDALISIFLFILIVIIVAVVLFILPNQLANLELQKKAKNIIGECKLKGLSNITMKEGEDALFITCRGKNKQCFYKIEKGLLGDVTVTSECTYTTSMQIIIK